MDQRTCAYVASKERPDSWHGQDESEFGLDAAPALDGLGISEWNCPHPPLEEGDGNYCIFHTIPGELPDDVDEAEALLEALNHAGESPWDGRPEHRGQFVGATFGTVDLLDEAVVATENYGIRFDHAQFNGRVKFGKTTFETRGQWPISFRKANFRGGDQYPIIFDGVTLRTNGEGYIRFDHVTFESTNNSGISFGFVDLITEGPGKILFKNVTFRTDSSDNISFTNLLFRTGDSGDIAFNKAIFRTDGGGDISLNDPTFESKGSGDVRFDEATFVTNGSGNIGFDRPTFKSEGSGDVGFNKAIFRTNASGDIEFNRPLFEAKEGGEVQFDKSIFKASNSGGIYFKEPRFEIGASGEVKFHGARFNSAGEGNVAFVGGELDKVDFHAADFGQSYFLQTDFSGAKLWEATVTGISINGETSCERLYEKPEEFDKYDWDSTARVYHDLKTVFSDHGLVGKARKMHFRERMARNQETRAVGGWRDLRYIGSLLSRIFTGYGVRVRYLGFWMVFLFSASTLVYGFMGVRETPFQTLSYSVLAYTVAPPSVPSGIWTQCVMMIETFCGTLSIVLLGYVLGNREQF